MADFCIVWDILTAVWQIILVWYRLVPYWMVKQEKDTMALLTIDPSLVLLPTYVTDMIKSWTVAHKILQQTNGVSFFKQSKATIKMNHSYR